MLYPCENVCETTVFEQHECSVCETLTNHVHEKSLSDSSSVKSMGRGGAALRSCFRISSSETCGEFPSTHSANLYRGGVTYEIMYAALTELVYPGIQYNGSTKHLPGSF